MLYVHLLKWLLHRVICVVLHDDCHVPPRNEETSASVTTAARCGHRLCNAKVHTSIVKLVRLVWLRIALVVTASAVNCISAPYRYLMKPMSLAYSRKH